jgi:predicted ATPase/DNA-binding SARP family transcriptional activator
MDTPPLTIQMFGPLSVRVHGHLMPRVRGRSIEWLLALLILRGDRVVDRSWLAGTLWPDSDESQALRNLRDALVHIRKALGPERERLQSPTRDTLNLDLDGAEVDMVRFDRAITLGTEEALREAVELYGGTLLEGCSEEWILSERVGREQSLLRSLEYLAESAENRRDYSEALALLRRAEQIEGLRDSTQRGLMRILASTGDAPAALYSYRQYRVRLREEMNVEPDQETVGLYQEIRDQAMSSGVRPSPRLGLKLAPVPRVSLSSLPHPITALIGREEESHDIVEALSRARLITLSGGGGVGKTRLAIHVAGEFAGTSGARPAFVGLASLSDPDLLPAFVLSTLGISEDASADPAFLTQALSGWLSMHETVLVLDNCEHLIVAAAGLSQVLLERCPKLRILTTSRQRLGVTGETIIRVRPLALPAVTDKVEDVLCSPAVQLFMERALMAQPELRLEDGNDVAAVVRICQRLDGIPLALELAAARVSALSLDQIAARLDDRFRLLTLGSRTALPRHQTLRALIDWSFDLLSEEEARLLQMLSIFPGGWTLETAEALLKRISSQATDGVSPPDAVDILSSLADKSLIVLDSGLAGRRYRMLETIKEYSLEKLRARGQDEGARLVHLECVIEMAERESAILFGPLPEPALNRLQDEVDNLRAALVFAQSDLAPKGSLLQLASPLWLFWDMRSHYSEGLDYLNAAIAQTAGCKITSAEARSLARALLGATGLRFNLRDNPESARLARQSLELFQSLGDVDGIAASRLHVAVVNVLLNLPGGAAASVDSLNACRSADWTYGQALVHMLLAIVALREGDPERCRVELAECLTLIRTPEDSRTPFYCIYYFHTLGRQQIASDWVQPVLEQCVSIARRVGEKRGSAVLLQSMGENASRNGDVAFGLLCFEEAAEIHRTTGSYFTLAFALQDIGNWHYRAAQYESAMPAYSESLDLFRRHGSKLGHDTAANTLGSTLYHLGHYDLARQHHLEALTLYVEAQNLEGVTWSLERLAITERQLRQPAGVAKLFGAAECLRESFGSPMDPWDQADWEEAVAATRLALGEAAFEAECTEGRALTRGRAISDMADVTRGALLS